MYSAPVPIAPAGTSLNLILASGLFSAVAELGGRNPGDGVYADTLLARAFQHLITGFGTEDDADALRACAGNITECTYLSGSVRLHIGKTLRDAADGSISRALAGTILLAAADRQMHGMVIDAMRSIASDGLAEIAGAIELLAPNNKRKH